MQMIQMVNRPDCVRYEFSGIDLGTPDHRAEYIITNGKITEMKKKGKGKTPKKC